MFKKNKKPEIEGRQRRSRHAEERPASFSYHARRSDQLLNTGRVIARSETAAKARAASRYWQQRFGFGILLIVGLVCLIYISTLSTQPRVVLDETVLSKAVLQDNSVYENAAADLLKSSILNRNKITLSTNELSSRLAARFPELASVRTSLPVLTHRVVLYGTSAEPVIILASPSGSYALDVSGVALLTGAQLSSLSSLNLPLVTDESNLPVKIRHQALTSSNVSFILTVLAQLHAKKLPVSSVSLPAGASELDVHLEGQPYFVKFNLQSNSSRQQVGTFMAVYKRLQEQSITPGQYVDVRVDGRAYYK